jgi:hypothetical protein
MAERKEALRMDAQTTEIAIKAFIREIVERLDQASGIAKAAQTCAETGNVAKAVEIALGIEQPIYEAGTLMTIRSTPPRLHSAH